MWVKILKDVVLIKYDERFGSVHNIERGKEFARLILGKDIRYLGIAETEPNFMIFI